MYLDWHLCDAVPRNCGAKKTGTRTKHIQGVVRNRLNLADKGEFSYLLSSDFLY